MLICRDDARSLVPSRMFGLDDNSRDRWAGPSRPGAHAPSSSCCHDLRWQGSIQLRYLSNSRCQSVIHRAPVAQPSPPNCERWLPPAS